MTQNVQYIPLRRRPEVSPLSCAIVIPIYNEEDSVLDTLHRLKRVISRVDEWVFEVVCIDDGSTDRTPALLASVPGIRVITHQVNRGYGAALRTGLDACTQEWVFITDADGTYPLEDLPRLLDEAGKGADMVVGVRQGRGINIQPFHRAARWTLRKMAHTLSGVMVPDLNSGMRLFRHKLFLEFRNLLPMGFSFTTTLTLAALYNNYKTTYLPISYAARVGHSNIKPVADFLAFTMLLIRIASYFEPLRFFLPLSLSVMLFGFAKGTIDFVRLGAIGSLAIITLLMGVQIFITGILAEVIVRRSTPPWRPEVPQGRALRDTIESEDVVVHQ
jgi:glycosyltransferase involved in cell wall biosynthesis